MYEIKDLEFRDKYCRVLDFSYEIFNAYNQTIVSNKYYLEIAKHDDGGIDVIDKVYGDSVCVLEQKANAHWRGILEPFLREIK